MDLGIYPGPYARAHRLIQIVGSWKATEMRVSGSPKPLVPVQSMIECARGAAPGGGVQGGLSRWPLAQVRAQVSKVRFLPGAQSVM